MHACMQFFKTPSGVKVQELGGGNPAAGASVAASGDLVLIDYILRRSNGYFIYGTYLPSGAAVIRLCTWAE